MWCKAIFLGLALPFLGCSEVNEIQNLVTQNDMEPTRFEYIESYRIDSAELPNGMKLTITQGLEVAVKSRTENTELREYSYNYLIYSFHFPNGRHIKARTYFDEINSISILGCNDPNNDAIKFVEYCSDWDELKKTILMLSTLDFGEISYLAKEGYVPLNFKKFGITTDAYSDWKEQFNYASSKGAR